MRRIADLKVRSKKFLAQRTISGPVLRIAWDLVYWMARYDRRLRVFCRCTSPREISVLAPWRKPYERRGYYESRASFDIDLHPFINLRVLKVVDSSAFDMSSISNTCVKKLKLLKVSSVRMKGPVNTVLQEIALKDVRIPYEDIANILGIESLVSVSLTNVDILGCNDWQERLLERLREMPGLKKIVLASMGVSVQRFADLCIERGLGWFRIAEEGMCLDVRLCSFSSVVRCVGILRCLSELDLEMVEAIHVGGSDLKYMRETLPNLKALHVTQAEIDSKALKAIYLRYPNLIRLGFSECIFSGTSFYEIIMHFKRMLRHLDLTSSRLPHDYISFLEKTLCSCSVRLKSGELITIDNPTSGTLGR
ncbi:hypothetical protein KMI_02g03400 [Encephalitozoon hellem]|nr:hypothetical protein KMI_02g03400 [Encephalitozoon hellem]